jgi:hypothetical protein
MSQPGSAWSWAFQLHKSVFQTPVPSRQSSDRCTSLRQAAGQETPLARRGARRLLVLLAERPILSAARNLHTAGTSQAGGLIFAYLSPPLRQIDTMPNIGDPPCLTTAVVPVRP